MEKYCSGCERWQSYKFPKANHNFSVSVLVSFLVVNVGKVTNFRKQIITTRGWGKITHLL